VAVGPSGKIFVVDSDNSRIVGFKKSGKFERVFGNQHLSYPKCIAVDRRGQVFVADTCNHRITVFNGEGFFESAFGREPHEQGAMLFPEGVAVDLDGTVFFTGTQHSIVVFKSNGDYVRTLGGVGAGELYYPKGVAVDGNGYSERRTRSSMLSAAGLAVFCSRIHCGVEVTELSTNKQHSLSTNFFHVVFNDEDVFFLFLQKQQPAHRYIPIAYIPPGIKESTFDDATIITIPRKHHFEPSPVDKRQICH
jgi:hypothetical protein